MIRKIISTSIFSLAIACGIGVGYGVVTTSQFAYRHVSSYVQEIRTELVFKKTKQQEPQALGGPQPEIIIESDLNETLTQYTKNFTIKKNKQNPRISSLSYLVADLDSGKVLLSQNINQQLPIASITKLMTAIVADETLGLDTRTTISNEVINTYGTQGNLKKGETYSVLELFYPLLLESSNDAAEALAYTKSRESFISDMNGKAKSIGLLNTSFDDASGLSSNNTSTVTDLFRLTQYVSRYRNYILEISTEKKKELGKKEWFSNSRFRSDRDYVGGKNGYTDEAQKTQVVVFKEDFDGDTRKIVYIVLRSSDVAYDVKMLRDFVHKNVSYE
jgi:D-alanyl-D-alanine carboxypeptidase